MTLWTVLIAIVVFLLSSQNLPLELILSVLPSGPHTDLTNQLTRSPDARRTPFSPSQHAEHSLEPQGLMIWGLAFGIRWASAGMRANVDYCPLHVCLLPRDKYWGILVTAALPLLCFLKHPEVEGGVCTGSTQGRGRWLGAWLSPPAGAHMDLENSKCTTHMCGVGPAALGPDVFQATLL